MNINVQFVNMRPSVEVEQLGMTIETGPLNKHERLELAKALIGTVVDLGPYTYAEFVELAELLEESEVESPGE